MSTVNHRLTTIPAVLILVIVAAWLIGNEIISPSITLGIALFLNALLYLSFGRSHSLREILFILVVVIVFIYPVAQIRIGDIPLYIADIALGLLWVDILLSKQNIFQRFQNSRTIFDLYILFWLPSTIFVFFHEVYLTQNIVETTYMLFRTLLSLGFCILIPIVIQNTKNYRRLLHLLAACLLITSLIGIAAAFLPPDSSLILILDGLTPTDVAAKQEMYQYSTGVVRTGGLIGGPNHFGNMIIILWALALSLYFALDARFLRVCVVFILLLGLLALAVTYTRTAYIGFAFMLCWFIGRLHSGRLRIFGILTVLIISFTVANSVFELVEVNYLSERFESLIGVSSGSDAYSNEARLRAYVEMPKFLIDHPTWLVVGRGFATYDLWLRGLLSDAFLQSPIANTQNHSLLVMTFYQRGLLGALLLVGLWIVAFRTLFTIRTPHLVPFSISLQACLIGVIPAWLFDHFFASTIHMQTIMFIVWGLTISLKNLDIDISHRVKLTA